MTSNVKEIIKGIVNQKAQGPSTSFSMFHVFYLLELISKTTMGRNKLAKKLEVGEGVVRTIINHLKDAELINTSKKGCNLTKKA